MRVALGATSADIRLVLADAMRIVGWGAGVGLVAALVSGRLLASQLFGVAPVDPMSVASAAVLSIIVAAGAAYVPAHWASRTDPVTALRSE